MFSRDRVRYKSEAEIAVMRRAGLVVAEALAAVRASLRPGTTTDELDAVAAEVIRSRGATSNFLGYHGFPKTICASVNDEVVHGIPGARVLAAGDLVSIDCGAVVEGWHGDAAFTAVVPAADGTDVAGHVERDLVEATREAMWRGIAALRIGGRIGEVGDAIDDYVEEEHGGRWGLVEEYTGHGIGTAMHEPPEVLNYRADSRGPRVRAGLVVAVEPMLTAGSPACRVLADDWTVVTQDGRRAAHFEHTVAVLPDGLWVLTAPDGGVEKLGGLDAAVSRSAVDVA